MSIAVPSATTLKAKLFRSFADPSRLSILEVLRDGSLTVGTIVEKTGLSQSNVSNHLRCLSDCDLVVAQSQGRYTRYQLRHPKIADLFALTEENLRDIGRSVYECTNYREEHPCMEKEGCDGE